MSTTEQSSPPPKEGEGDTSLYGTGDISLYGVGDASFKTAGGEQGIRQLAKDFYEVMAQLPQAQRIHQMHPGDVALSADKLARFLCGWLGGPKLYQEKYGSIQIPKAHNHLDIGVAERDAWLKCMELALEKQPYHPSFKQYLVKEFFRPAERSRTRD